MDKFPHVEDQQIRDLLEYGWNGDEDEMCSALFKTRQAFEQDRKNEMIPEAVLRHREDSIDDAEGWWNEEGDGFSAADSLRDYWRV
jgi:hypothetical protein